MVKLLLLAVASFLSVVNASNPFSSNVAKLTSANFKEEVLDSPHNVFVNLCCQGWGYCQQLNPKWEKLTKAVKGTVKVTYWGTK